MSRGFVTIATGNHNFYRIAANLLRSYRCFAQKPEPFAIICDRRTRETDLFDQTVILENPGFSYLDKLRLPEYAPFDETIFLDADSLAYKDLNAFWDLFRDADDFSAFGKNLPPDSGAGWFRKEDTGVYQDRIRSIPDFIGGVYFLRKTEKLEEFSGDLQAHFGHLSRLPVPAVFRTGGRNGIRARHGGLRLPDRRRPEPGYLLLPAPHLFSERYPFRDGSVFQPVPEEEGRDSGGVSGPLGKREYEMPGLSERCLPAPAHLPGKDRPAAGNEGCIPGHPGDRCGTKALPRAEEENQSRREKKRPESRVL